MSESKELLIKTWDLKDYVFFLIIIPFFLIFVFLLPQNIKSDFTLHPKDPSILSIYFSNFVHVDLMHFLGNITQYLFILFMIFNLETNKKTFRTSTFFILTILPITTSLVIVYFLPMLKNVLGFSAIVSGFFGYFIYSVSNYIRNIFKVKITSSFIWLLLVANLTLVILFNGYYDKFVIAIVGLLILLYGNLSDIKKVLIKIKMKNKEINRLSYFGLV